MTVPRLPGRRGALVALAGAAAALAGCASPRPLAQDGRSWSGRLALDVQDDASKSFSAGFELKGAADDGELVLLTPLGSTLAVMAWAPGRATLRSGESVRHFDSLEALAAHATGAPLPVAALFDWLRGVDTPVAGWTTDLSQVARGRLRARRTDPAPALDLRAVFDH